MRPGFRQQLGAGVIADLKRIAPPAGACDLAAILAVRRQQHAAKRQSAFSQLGQPRDRRPA